MSLRVPNKPEETIIRTGPRRLFATFRTLRKRFLTWSTLEARVSSPSTLPVTSFNVPVEAKSQSFNSSAKVAPQPFSLNKTFSIVKQVTQCQPTTSFNTTFNANFSVSVDAQISGSISYGIAVAGTVVPPNFSDFELTANFSADMNGTLNFLAQGTVSPLCLFLS